MTGGRAHGCRPPQIGEVSLAAVRRKARARGGDQQPASGWWQKPHTCVKHAGHAPGHRAADSRRSSGVSLLELVVGRKSSDLRCDNYLGQRTDILSKDSSGGRAAVSHSPRPTKCADNTHYWRSGGGSVGEFGVGAGVVALLSCSPVDTLRSPRGSTWAVNLLGYVGRELVRA